ncbi:hypothetical protein PTSG_01351 [Salpingoeca rosetta]|uniref:Nudix hydrolase domain-containing protein n=1 Tax=Salpingoeca rosetta (strain ATCC 50818 / BSB-021) TaxID=946362 RepID=F2U034_SALR5|nr:uncharacterized protein PTSG_01351 [Salpingoeca rosetta]EGD80762.1 hypothetical protein PTSG_01351 [Salpingoeca rosetta]|eukprot:XP_004997323.1 hypothetical protein PTSG_01351 [Salpingoeca rosetta]
MDEGGASGGRRSPVLTMMMGSGGGIGGGGSGSHNSNNAGSGSSGGGISHSRSNSSGGGVGGLGSGRGAKARWRQKRWWYMVLGGIACFTVLRLMFASPSSGGHGRKAEVVKSKRETVPYFDNTFGEELGVLPIEDVHEQGLAHYGVVVLAYRPKPNSGGNEVEMLLSKRSSAVHMCPRQWLLVGEHAQREEDAVTMALRGLREELGIFASADDLTHLCDVPFQHEFSDGKRENQMTHLVLATLPSFQHIDLDAETKEVKWFSPAEILDMAKKHQLCGEALSDLVFKFVTTACQRLREEKQLDCGIEIDAGAFVCPESDQHA